MLPHMVEYGRRTQELPAPPHVVWSDLRTPRREGVRAWLDLQDDERAPAILEADEPTRIVWSSLWPDRPDDRIELIIAPYESETALEFVWSAPEGSDVPSAGRIGHVRKRLNVLLFGELRYSYGQ